MKQSEVHVGDRVCVRIGSELAPCIVMAEVQDVKHSYTLPGLGRAEKIVIRYRIRRENESTPLPKLRPASALRKKNELRF